MLYDDPEKLLESSSQAGKSKRGSRKKKGVHKKANQILKRNGLGPSGPHKKAAEKLVKHGLIDVGASKITKDNAKSILKQNLEGAKPEDFGSAKPKPKKSASGGKGKADSRQFYRSWEWKQLRYKVLKHYGARCMCCGSDYRPVVDHIKPVAKYWELRLEFSNCQVLCNECNMGKGRWDETDWRPTDQKEPEPLGENDLTYNWLPQ